MLSFREIAFKAELDRHESPTSEFTQHAKLLCDEDPGTREDRIRQFRNMIYDKNECKPHRLDDEYLKRFLRARRFVPARAHRLLVRYCNFRAQNPHLWQDVYWYGLARLGDIFEGVLFDRPDVGRLIICRLGQWDPDRFPADELVRGCLLLLEVGIMQPKLQVLGGTALLDCEGISMAHMRQLSPSIAVHAMNVMGYAFPLHQRGLHIINCSRVFEALFTFLSGSHRMTDFGNEYTFMVTTTALCTAFGRRYIDPECLPVRYGGHREEVSLGEWLTKIWHYRNHQFDEDMKILGYAVD